MSAVSIPAQSAILGRYEVIHLADAYAISLPEGSTASAEQLARFIFGHQPRWIGGLMKARDAIVKPFGLKTAAELARGPAKEQVSRVGIFRVYSRSELEVILGQDDSHLDFRLSVLRQRVDDSAAGSRLVVSTVVHCHNRLGRIYIGLIAPFHRLAVRACLKRAARLGWPA